MLQEKNKFGKSPKIFVVEDDLVIQKVYQIMLKRLGFEVEVVDTGQAAIDRTATEDYAAMLLDLGLPGKIQGEGVIVTIRDREQTTGKRLPILVNSAHAAEAILQSARNKGADIALMKPVSQNDLLFHLEQLGLLLPNPV